MGGSVSQSEHSHDQSPPKKPIIGRFAPSPTGPLHFGSLIAAVASYLNVRKNSGQWLLRIENIDTQREQKGSSQLIIQTLEDYGFEWDGDIRTQSQHLSDYEAALEKLKGVIYPCSCTRKELQAAAATGKYSYIYPGFCRKGLTNQKTERTAIRLRSDQPPCCKQTHFTELCQRKAIQQNIETDVGDFILKRSDGLFAYQLAVVVDDELQGVSEVVRGADLFDNTPRQVYLQCLLGYSQPDYLHFPVAVDPAGKKLSKQNLSPQISANSKRAKIIAALSFLGQKPPSLNNFSRIDDLWSWAVQNWDHSKIPKTLTQPLPDHYE